jgi:hypothetical protein
MVAINELVDNFYRKEKVRLWTIQIPEVWEGLKERGVLRGDGRRVWPDHRHAYQWLMQQMKQRLANCSGHRYPVWAWYYPKPDLRYSGIGGLIRGTKAVRIELLVSRERVLLLDFDAWNAVLFGKFLGLSEQDDRVFELLLSDSQTQYSQLPKNLQEKMETSWQRVFDFNALGTSELGYVSFLRYIQAVVEEVWVDDVVSIKPFVAR